MIPVLGKEMHGLIPYILMYGVIFCGTIVTCIRDFKDHKKAYCVLVFSALILLLGLRHPSMGIDLGYYREYGYLHSYDQLGAYSWKTLLSFNSYLNYEWGYVILNKVIADLSGGNRQVFLLVCAFLSIAPVGYIVYKKSDNAVLSTVIYMGIPPFLLLFSGLRQVIAVGICFWGLQFIEKKQFWKFLATVLLASVFHRTALVFLVAYPVYHIRLTPSLRWGTLALIAGVYVLRVPLFRVFGSLFPSYSAAGGGGSISLFLIFCAIYIFCCVFADPRDERTCGYVNLFLLACICQAFGSISNLAIRVGYYFIMILMVLLPAVLSGMKRSGERKLMNMLIMLCFIYQGLDCLSSTYWAMSNPYLFFWMTP